jgi:hypothetical protein
LFLFVISGVFLFSRTSIGAEPVAALQPERPPEQPPARWLVDIGVGFRAGGCFLSGPTNGRKFIRGTALGAELDWGVFVLGPHRVVLGAGFLWFSPERRKGTAAVNVSTRYTRIDFSAGYDFSWRLLVAGAQVGLGLGVNSVKTEYGVPTWEVDGQQVVFHDPAEPEVKEKLGVDPGFLAGLSVGMELGRLWGFPGMLEIRAKSDYVLRGARNEFTALGVIVFWPMALKSK